MDGIAKEQVKKHEKSMYLYKKKVMIPSLEMVDDLLNISQCGIDSTINNSYLVTKIEGKKLQLNEDKCKHMHVGEKNEDFFSSIENSRGRDDEN